MKKDKVIPGLVIAGTPANDDQVPLPAGKALYVESAACTDTSRSQRPGIVRLLWGSGVTFETIAVVAATGGTGTVLVKRALMGDGVKFLRVQRENADNSGSKEIVALVIMSDRAVRRPA